jgi:hypothetical protein
MPRAASTNPPVNSQQPTLNPRLAHAPHAAAAASDLAVAQQHALQLPLAADGHGACARARLLPLPARQVPPLHKVIHADGSTRASRRASFAQAGSPVWRRRQSHCAADCGSATRADDPWCSVSRRNDAQFAVQSRLCCACLLVHFLASVSAEAQRRSKSAEAHRSWCVHPATQLRRHACCCPAVATTRSWRRPEPRTAVACAAHQRVAEVHSIRGVCPQELWVVAVGMGTGQAGLGASCQRVAL